MDLQLLGPIRATVDGRPIALGATKQRAVLAMLALDANRTVSVDRLIEGLWGEEVPDSAPKMVQHYVSQLRKLGADIETHGRGYALRLAPAAVDAARFKDLTAAGAAREALTLWRGPPLADVAGEPFAPAEIRALEELWLGAREQAIDEELAAGRHADLIAELEALVAAHPLQERLHGQRMLALYRAGRQAEALSAYRDARSVLVEQIGVEPGPELRRLHAAILAQDPALEPPSSPPARATPAARPPRRRVPVLAVALALIVAGAAVFAVSRLVAPKSLGRIDENAVGLIDPGSGRITAEYRVGHGPEAVAAGAGSVWVANRLDGTVSRLDRGGGQTVIEVGGEPTALAFGAGSLWVADGQGRTVSQLDPVANRVVHRFDVGNAADAVAAGFGALWVASAVDATVVRIDLATDQVSKPIGVEARPSALAAGAGAIWVASDATARVVRLDPRSGRPLAGVSVGNGSSGIAARGGAVWVANRRDGTVSRIDAATNVAETRRVGREPLAVAAGDHGVWVADAGDARILEIDARSLRVTRTVGVTGTPVALADSGGRVWTAAQAGAASHRGGTLRVSVTALPAGVPRTFLDPTVYWAPESSLVYDGLVGYRRAGGAAGGALVPGVAGDLPEPSQDGRTYVFRLRPGVRFSTGAPVRPQDVRASLERLLALSPGLLPIDGASRCRVGRCDLSRAIGIDPAAGTVSIRLSRPDPDFLYKLHGGFVVPAGSPVRPTTTHPLPGTGPYRFARWDPWRGGRLIRNPYFHGRPDRPDGFPDQVAVRFDAPGAQVAAIDRGAADIAILQRGIGSAVELRARYGARLHSDPAAFTWYAFLNVHAPPFDDVRVRRALNYAVDRARVAELLGTSETHKPTCQLLPPGFQGYAPSCPFTVARNPAGTWIAPDLARARRLVAASGTRGMKVQFWGTRPWAALGRYFGSLLQRLGYRSSVRTFSDLHLIYETAAREPRRRPQLGLWVWIADSAGSFAFLQPLISCSGEVNLSRFCAPGLDASMKRAAGERGPEAIALWRRVRTSLAEQAPVVPLVNENDTALVAGRVGNYEHHPFWGPLLEQLWVR